MKYNLKHFMQIKLDRNRRNYLLSNKVNVESFLFSTILYLKNSIVYIIYISLFTLQLECITIMITILDSKLID